MLINAIESDSMSAMDRGLAYGDGLFTTMKVKYGQVQLWDFHLQRLQLGATRLFFPAIDWSLLTAEVLQVAKTVAHEKQSVIKVIVTRGSGGRGYSTQECHAPLRIISTATYPAFYQQWQEQGIKLILCESQLGRNKQLAGLKTLNRLEQVLIKKELENKQALDGIVCDDQGYVIEACSANLFIYLDNGWKTPKLDKCGVAGVQRRHVMFLAKKSGINIVESDIHISALKRAKAICLSNALMGLVPVNQYQQHILEPELCRPLQSLIKQGNY